MKLKIGLILIPIVFMAVSCDKKIIVPSTPEIVYKTGMVSIAGHRINVQIADTAILRAQGLSDRDSLGTDDGMLFIFPTQDKYAFWMKGMRFALDFIWISQGKVVQITPNALAEPNVPDSALMLYLPDIPVDSVLEVNTGWAEKNRIKVGDAAELTQ